ncbi:MAG: hypothetical protein C0412_07955 [Flavobacterium sp.]|nr:hypothetical protein [Flavobacterium sp.]
MKTLINVCGTARSGSTLLDLILGNDRKGFSLGELYAWFRPFRTHHFQIKCSCDGSNCPWDKLKKLKEESFYENAFRTLNVDFLVDSSKDIPWVVDNNLLSRKNNIKVFNILLYKDPISFFYSFWKRGVSIQKAREAEFKKYYNRFFQTRLPFVSLNYNNFVANPEHTIQKLCALLGIPYFKDKTNFWEKQHHHVFGSMGTRKQTEEKASKIMSKEDYPLDYQKIIPQIKEETRNDLLFCNILEKLNYYDLCSHDEIEKSGEIKKPYWYFILKNKQKIKKHFPEKWKYDQ